MLPNVATRQRHTHTHTHTHYNNNNKPLISIYKGQEEVKSFLLVSYWLWSKINRLRVDSVRSKTGGSLWERKRNRD